MFAKRNFSFIFFIAGFFARFRFEIGSVCSLSFFVRTIRSVFLQLCLSCVVFLSDLRETKPSVSCPHHWVYRTVCPEGAEAPHPGFYSLFNRSESNRKYDNDYYL
jgi:hypothetical protein